MSLKKVAAVMHTEALQNGRSRRVIMNGLQVTLFYRKEDIVLALQRKNRRPSLMEQKICRSAFLFDYPLSNQAIRGNTVYLAIDLNAIYGCSTIAKCVGHEA